MEENTPAITFPPAEEEEIPSLPIDTGISFEALPELTPEEEFEAQLRTREFLAKYTGANSDPPPITKKERDTAKQITPQSAETIPSLQPNRISSYPNPVIAHLASMVNQHSFPLLPKEARPQYQDYIINWFVRTVEETDDVKTRISALRGLGEVTGVDAFVKKVEQTIIHKPIEQVEKELKEVLEGIEYTVVTNNTP
jgi:hypothetical protein